MVKYDFKKIDPDTRISKTPRVLRGSKFSMGHGKMAYNFKKIETKWQQRWLKEKVYEPSLKSAKAPFYNLMMFPYPSAEGLHVGNMYAFTGADIYGRFKRMQGYDVFEPIGLDGFGIHSENYALKIGTHPAKQSKISEKRFYKQLASIGNGFAWNEHLETYDPEYYKWTQWIFAEMFKKGLAYRKKQAVNWCPSCKTVLADEQVLQKSQARNPKFQTNSNFETSNNSGGVCERCGTEVFKKELEQWFFRITKYADRLLKGLPSAATSGAKALGKAEVGAPGLDWSDRVKIAQENWIGQSEGSLIRFALSRTYAESTQMNAGKGQRGSALSLRGSVFIEVFTTRPDTLFGATYLVLAPENRWLEQEILNPKSEIRNKAEVEEYIKKAKAKSEEERISEGKGSPSLEASEGHGKTGVELKGVKAVNPANGEEIPIWVADYVLGSYGTGAIMAVPAHDERDFEFATKFKLPIKQVIAPKFLDPINPPRVNKTTVRRRTVHAIVKRVKDEKILMLQWKGEVWGAHPPRTFIIGGVEDGEDIVKSAEREVFEETGYKNLRFVKKLKTEVHTEYFAAHKDQNRYSEISVICFEIDNDEPEPVSADETRKHDPVWIDEKEVLNFVNVADGPFIWSRFRREDAYAGGGVLINSDGFNGMDSEKTKWEITKFVGGERKIQYRLRNWLISRQRYWGPPIPLVFCEACKKQVENSKSEARNPKRSIGEIENPGWVSVPEDQLPVKLPIIKDFKPLGTGKSPLATDPKFYKTKCPKCGGPATRETDVSDTFLDSAWYYLGYLAKENSKFEIRNSKFKHKVRKWLPIDLYTGGAEHSVLHLLYVRFLAKVFHDWKLVNFDEPAKKFRAHGLLIKDGAKMSKSKGNVINPDEYIEKFGADTLRMYLMFLAPFEQGGDFRDSGILGVERFLNRAWHLIQNSEVSAKGRSASSGKSQNYKSKVKTDNTNFERLLNKTIKKVTEDIETLNYNTAVSAMMILLNEMEKQPFDRLRTKKFHEFFLKLLAPFAPHMAEELWQQLRGQTRTNTRTVAEFSAKSASSQRKSAFRSIHLEEWPKYDPKLIKDEKFTLVIQINGRVRDSVEVEAGISQVEAEKLVLAREKVKEYLREVKPKKVIFVPGRLVNLVI